MSNASQQAQMLWTPANVITIIRICLVPVFVAAILSPWPSWLGLEGFTDAMKSLVAAGVFIVISCTDWIDGYLARSRNEVTDFGKFMDPLADKILVAAALLCLVELQVLPSWPVLIILTREFIVSGVRMIAATQGEVIAASWVGKAKTVFQILAIILFIIKDVFYIPVDPPHNPFYLLSWAVMIVALILTIASMMDYLAKARHLIGFSRSAKRSSKKQRVAKLQKLEEGTEEELPPADDTLAALSAIANEQPDALELAQAIVSLGTSQHLTVATAESLTGGMIGETLTAIPGSSSVVQGGIISYTNQVKHHLLDVPDSVLANDGAVSEATAKTMAQGAQQSLNADFAVAVTGIAGPGGAEPNKPVGTVWIAVHTPQSTSAQCFHFEGDRASVRAQTTHEGLQLLYQAMLETAE